MNLTAKDPRTFRRYSIRLSPAIVETGGAVLSAHLEQTAVTLMIEWTRRYKTSFPYNRAEWSIERS